MHVVDMLVLSGMEYGVIKLLNRLDPARFTPMVCCLRSQADETKPLLCPSVSVFALGKRPGHDFGVIRRLAALLHRERVDIVHSHNWPTFFDAVVAATLARVPVLVHGEHGRENQAALPWRRRLLSRFLARGVSRLVAVSRNISCELLDEWKVKPEWISEIPNGVDTEVFGQAYDLGALRRAFALTPENRVVMTIGGFRPVKDYPTLLRAFALLYRTMPEARLMLVGRSPDNHMQGQLETLANELGIREVVRFPGTRHDTPQLLALCDVYVNSSVYEGMSNTILEAMAARKPVVATAVGGTPDLVCDQLTGVLVPPGNDHALAERLEILLSDPARAQTMGAAGRERVLRNHSMARMIQAYSDLYEEMTCRGRDRGTGRAGSAQRGEPPGRFAALA